jgi:hypothetical protein
MLGKNCKSNIKKLNKKKEKRNAPPPLDFNSFLSLSDLVHMARAMKEC